MKKFAPFLVGGLLLIGVIWYFAQDKSQFYKWSHEYDIEGENPYDMKILYNLLDNKFDFKVLKERITRELPVDEPVAEKITYLYIGKRPEYTEEEAWHLRNFVKSGGNAFVITSNIQDSLAEILFYPEDCGSATTWNGRNPGIYTEKVYAGFKHPSINDHYYEYQYVSNQYSAKCQWKYIPKGAFCNSIKRENPIAALGTFVVAGKDNNTYNNFMRLQVGKGYFYFHTNPIMFTNMYMVDSAGFEYGNYVFSHVNTENVFWDRESLSSPQNRTNKRRDKPDIPALSPLEYIFSQPSLRWSWFLLLILGVVFVLFGAKRRQRKIPVLQSNRNTSLEFVETIGSLYFQQQDHKGIIKKQMQLFLAHLRQRYNLVTHDLDDRLINRIATRSKVDVQIINDVFVEYFRLKKVMQKPYANVSAKTLNNFYLLIERFHVAVKKTQFIKEDA